MGEGNLVDLYNILKRELEFLEAEDMAEGKEPIKEEVNEDYFGIDS